jgi:hypothetical protein
MPTTAPALNMPVITEQLLKHNKSKMMEGKYIFFMVDYVYCYNNEYAQLVSNKSIFNILRPVFVQFNQ